MPYRYDFDIEQTQSQRVIWHKSSSRCSVFRGLISPNYANGAISSTGETTAFEDDSEHRGRSSPTIAKLECLLSQAWKQRNTPGGAAAWSFQMRAKPPGQFWCVRTRIPRTRRRRRLERNERKNYESSLILDRPRISSSLTRKLTLRVPSEFRANGYRQVKRNPFWY